MYVGGIIGRDRRLLLREFAAAPEVINPFLAVLIPLGVFVASARLLMALIYSFLTVTLRANQNVTGPCADDIRRRAWATSSAARSSSLVRAAALPPSALNATGNLL